MLGPKYSGNSTLISVNDLIDQAVEKTHALIIQTRDFIPKTYRLRNYFSIVMLLNRVLLIGMNDFPIQIKSIFDISILQRAAIMDV